MNAGHLPVHHKSAASCFRMDRYSAARVQVMVESAHRFGGDPLQDPGFHFENVNVEPCRFATAATSRPM